MDKESKPAWNVLGLDANLGNVRYGGKLTVRLGGSESQLRVGSSHWPVTSQWITTNLKLRFTSLGIFAT